MIRKGEFEFSVYLFGSTIALHNHHREAVKGNGTPARKSMDKAFGALALRINSPVQVYYDTFGQEDTKKWLVKGDYTQVRETLYVKSFFP